jgi:hypothetical protein
MEIYRSPRSNRQSMALKHNLTDYVCQILDINKNQVDMAFQWRGSYTKADFFFPKPSKEVKRKVESGYMPTAIRRFLEIGKIIFLYKLFKPFFFFLFSN